MFEKDVRHQMGHGRNIEDGHLFCFLMALNHFGVPRSSNSEEAFYAQLVTVLRIFV